MKKYLSLALFSGTLILSAAAFADTQLEFPGKAVTTSQPGGPALTVVMHMDNGQKHATKVILQNDVAVKDLTNGNLVYLPSHKEVFEITAVSDGTNGTKIITIKPTNLVITGGKSMMKTMKNMPMTNTPMTSQPTTTTTTPGTTSPGTTTTGGSGY